jgi:RNA polymerase sigma factor (sigma-70 family)
MTPPSAEELVPRLFLGPALRAQSDRRLVRLVRDGYEAAFDEIMRRYGASLRRYAAALVGGRAEDVTQDAFSKALQAIRRNETEIELRPWLYRIVRNTALNDIRDRRPATLALADGIVGQGGVAEEVERREEMAELTDRLRALPEQQRAAIVMRELEGLGHDEIASALGISDGAARQAIHRARTALRDGLGMAIPLPLLRAMLEGAPSVEVAAGGAGAGLAFKAATATAIVAGTFGAGVALHQSRHTDPDGAKPPAATRDRIASTSGEATPHGNRGFTTSGSRGGPGEPGSAHHFSPGRSSAGEDGTSESAGSGSRRGSDRDGSSSGPRGDDHHSGSSPGGPDTQIRSPGEDSGGGGSGPGSTGTGGDSSGPGGNSGPGSVESGGGSGETGSGDGGSGSADSSGSGESLESNSGPDSGGDGSGDGGELSSSSG